MSFGLRGLFLCLELAPNLPLPFISGGAIFLYNSGMKEMIETLQRLGLPEKEIARIKACYADDDEGLRLYVAYMRALLEDDREFVD